MAKEETTKEVVLYKIKNVTTSDIELRVDEIIFTFPVGISEVSENKKLFDTIKNSIHKENLVIIRGK